tara:strand:- start:218 stop:487 length:270 start_codon:yes stop_codon:yes gene_type:complete
MEHRDIKTGFILLILILSFIIILCQCDWKCLCCCKRKNIINIQPNLSQEVEAIPLEIRDNEIIVIGEPLCESDNTLPEITIEAFIITSS